MTEEPRIGAFDRLLQAFLHHDQPALEELAREGIRVDLRDAHGHTVLLRAAVLGEATAVEWILQAGAEVDATSAPATSTSERTAFLLAAEHGHPKTTETLLAAGANPNRADSAGVSALMLAAEKGHLETVRFLVRSGVNLDLENHQGETALALARRVGHGAIVALLQALGAAAGTPATSTPATSTPATSTPAEAPVPESTAAGPWIADQKWQMPAAPQQLRNRPQRSGASEGSICDHSDDHIEDQISDWIEDEIE